jgi:anti-anti-sigma factor
VILAVRGELDGVNAPELGRIMATMVAGGHRQVMLDLAECDFIDPAGLLVIAGGAEHLDSQGGRLAIRSPSSVVRRLLNLVIPSELVGMPSAEAATPSPATPAPAWRIKGRLGAEEPIDPTGVAVTTGRHNIAPRLRTITAIPHADDIVDSALRLVVALACATVTGADGVSVSLSRYGRLSTVAATDQTVLDMDADQYASGEGPCVDASMEGRWLHAESLLSETRWPVFTPQALGLEINSIFSSPLVVRDQPVGGLNVYSRTPAAFAADAQSLASVFAEETSSILAYAGVDVTSHQLSGRIDHALKTRQVIAVAQGVMMEQAGIDEDHAYTVDEQRYESNVSMGCFRSRLPRLTT